jgi:xylulokinase
VKALIGLDVGTTTCKAVVFDPDGAVLGYGIREYGVLGGPPGAAEQDADAVWRKAMEALAESVSRAGVAEALAIGVSVQGDAVIPVGRDLAPLHNAVLGMDYRCAPQAELCAERFGARALFDRTGMRPHPITSLSKILWLKDERPQAYSSAWRIFTYEELILGRLGGEPVMDWTMASRTMAFDRATRSWADDLLHKLEIDPGLLSPTAASGTGVGRLSAEAASAVGLKPGALLVTGGHDQTCAALGAGMDRPGIGVLSAGTADVLSTASHDPLGGALLFDGFYPCTLHAVPGMSFTFGLTHTGGILLRWYRDTFGAEESRRAAASGRDPYDLLVESATRGPSPVMMLPHFNGSGNPACDASARGALLDLTLSTTRGDVVKALMECLAFETKVNVDYWSGAGIVVEELRAVGGGARSADWLQVRADVLGRPVLTLETREAACLGAAILAGTAAGEYGSVSEGVRRTVRLGRGFQPDARTSALYAERYGTYRRVSGAGGV